LVLEKNSGNVKLVTDGVMKIDPKLHREAGNFGINEWYINKIIIISWFYLKQYSWDNTTCKYTNRSYDTEYIDQNWRESELWRLRFGRCVSECQSLPEPNSTSGVSSHLFKLLYSRAYCFAFSRHSRSVLPVTEKVKCSLSRWCFMWNSCVILVTKLFVMICYISILQFV